MQLSLEDWLTQAVDNTSQETIDPYLINGLIAGCEWFNLETGIISHIDKYDYKILQTYSSLGEIFTPGEQFELQNTYCEAVVSQQKVITYKQVGATPEMRLHPVYVAIQLESYIGAPLIISQDEIIGTINFSSHAIREENFSQSDIDTIELMAKKISLTLQQYC